MKKLIIPFILLFQLFTSCDIIGLHEDNDDLDWSPIILTRAQESFVESGNKLAIRFLKESYPYNKGNSFLISPLSLQRALGMAMTGAEGTTKAEIAEVLGFDCDDSDIVNDYLKIILDGIVNGDKKNISFHNADMMLFNNKYFNHIDNNFITKIERSYDAFSDKLDFSKQSSVDKVNEWAKSKTEGLISNLFSSYSPYVYVYLISTMSFDGKWKYSFNTKFTAPGCFFKNNGETIITDMMKQTGEFVCLDYAFDGFSAASIPYGNGCFSMNIIVPHSTNGIEEIINKLDNDLFQSIATSEKYKNVTISIPKFETETTLNKLDSVLFNMGIKAAFSPKTADFTKIAPRPDSVFFNGGSFQKNYIKINESGSIAASATVLPVGIFSSSGVDTGPVASKSLVADRTFLYYITDNRTGVILFIGIYNGN